MSSLISRNRLNKKALVVTGVVSSILPDLDLLWFYLVDNRQTAHHEYFFHWPLFWIAIAVLAWLVSWAMERKSLWPHITVALVCLMLHMLLDSFAAEIYWLRPFSDFHLNIVKVPARFGWWVWNFVLHWTFVAEVLICLAAGLLFWRNRKSAV